MVSAVEKNGGGKGPRVGKAAVLSGGVRQVSLRAGGPELSQEFVM